MGVRGSFGALKTECECRKPGSADSIFRRCEFQEAKQHFSRHGGVVCMAATAYIHPDLHTQPWLAERLFRAGAHHRWDLVVSNQT